MTTQEKILKLFSEKREISVNDIATVLNISKQYIHRILNDLLDKDEIIKIGKAPKTYYKLKNKDALKSAINEEVNSSQRKFLADNFLMITEIGEILSGIDGFANWCIKRNLPLEKTIDEFIVTKEKYNKYLDDNNLISGLDKLKNTKGYEEIYLNEVLYLDFYAIERFGKTKLGTILHYAKQGQNKMLMRVLIKEIKLKVETILEIYKIDAVAFVPPTIKRQTQLMKVLENGLKINLPTIKIIKISGIIPVPQKSLNKLEERINNAENTFIVKEQIPYQNILLIDDAVGSGSTLNQIAGKIKRNIPSAIVVGLAIVGSYKGFDVITDI